MYEDFYELRARPFLTVPDPDYLYWSGRHHMAFTVLEYSILTRAPIAVVTGGIGTGKTTLLRKLLKDVPNELVTGLVSNMQADRGELLQWVMMALDQPVDTNEPYVNLFKRFQDFVIESYAAGRRILLIFDEAQNLTVDALEQLRLLSNINSDQDELLQIILVGQPQLRALLERPELEQFSQRVCADYNLTALEQQETSQYIQHRMAVAGATYDVFSQRTRDLIHEVTGGVPRLINVVCDICLSCGFAAERKVIDEELLREFLKEAEHHGIYNRLKMPVNTPTLVKSDLLGSQA